MPVNLTIVEIIRRGHDRVEDRIWRRCDERLLRVYITELETSVWHAYVDSMSAVIDAVIDAVDSVIV